MELVGLQIGAEPGAWEAAGFTVGDGAVALGDVRLTFGEGRAITGWTFTEPPVGDLDGLPTPHRGSGGGYRAVHPNGITRVDHVVAFSPDLDRTVIALDGAGLELRRRREGPTGGGSARQAFFWIGSTILEVVEHPPQAREAGDPRAPARLWGLAVVADDLDSTVTRAGDAIGAAKPAIQAGRRIATFRREVGLGLPMAVMSPHVAGHD